MKTNPFPLIPPENSKIVPAKYKKDFFSTAIVISLSTKILSSSLFVLSNFKSSKNNTDEIAYLQFSGPTQLCYQNKQIEGHSKNIHLHGYGMPIGKIEN